MCGMYKKNPYYPSNHKNGPNGVNPSSRDIAKLIDVSPQGIVGIKPFHMVWSLASAHADSVCTVKASKT